MRCGNGNASEPGESRPATARWAPASTTDQPVSASRSPWLARPCSSRRTAGESGSTTASRPPNEYSKPPSRVVGFDDRLPPAERVLEAAEPVGPRGQQRDAQGRAALRVGLEPLALAEQLLAVVAQRGHDHAELRRHGRRQRARRELMRDYQWTPFIR